MIYWSSLMFSLTFSSKIHNTLVQLSSILSCPSFGTDVTQFMLSNIITFDDTVIDQQILGNIIIDGLGAIPSKPSPSHHQNMTALSFRLFIRIIILQVLWESIIFVLNLIASHLRWLHFRLKLSSKCYSLGMTCN